MKAVWQDAVLAESDQTVVVEGNHYFPPHSMDKKYFEPSQTHSTCPWKGLQATIIYTWAIRIIPMRLGITLSRRTLPSGSRGITPSGAG
jgi:hypothetical protein